MDKIVTSLTVYFDGPFWAAVYERTEGGRYEAAQVVFGAEPKDGEVYQYFLQNWPRLRFSPQTEAGKAGRETLNPKRRQREARRMVEQAGVGTKAHQAVKLQQEQGRKERVAASRRRREEKQERKFALRQKKRKEKHRGH